MNKPIEHSDAYLNFCLRLSLLTQIDPIAYADWIRANQVDLSIEYVASGEDDPAVWARMRYVEALGRRL